MSLRDQLIRNFKEAKLEKFERAPLYETHCVRVIGARMDGVLARGDVEVTLVQWLRFGGGAYVRMIGMAPKDEWSKVFPRLRAVRDGIEPK